MPDTTLARAAVMVTTPSRPRRNVAKGRMPDWWPSALLLATTASLATMMGDGIRIAFVLGCGLTGWLAWQKNPASHLRTALILFVFAPCLRRVVDLVQGYDPVGLMLVGPLLAITVPILSASSAGSQGRRQPSGFEFVLIVAGTCVVYAAMLTALKGDLTNMVAGLLKWGAPLVYAALLHQHARRHAEGLLMAASETFAFILVITGLYGIVQYVVVPAWDAHWMQYAPITSVGVPRPFAVRTFSTMNSPASFAMFTVVGLVLLTFVRGGRASLLLAAPSVVSLLLSAYRTAWIALSVAIVFCLMFQPTRARALSISCGIFAAFLCVTTLTPFGETVMGRFATLGRGLEDDSGRERLDQLHILWNQPDTSRALFGSGFNPATDGAGSQMAVDGMVVGCWLTMGFFIGLVCLSALVWAALRAVLAASHAPTRQSVVVGALGCAGLVQLPLANIASGELGFLFWTFMAFAAVPSTRTG